tara:strand:+ start:1400 stop:1837 length:438 start_codon:yes stop_codon:yes gene_type:complete
MQKFLTSATIFILLAFATATTFAADIQTELLKSEVRERETGFAQSMQERNFESFLTFISSEAIFFNGDQSLIGIEAIARSWSVFFEGDLAPFSWQPELIEVLESGNLAISSGPVFGPTGEPAGRFNSIWRKDPDGKWRVVFDKGS